MTWMLNGFLSFTGRNKMPAHKVKGGWKWGSHGKVYPTKAQAEAQGRAAYASGYKGHSKKGKSRGRKT